MVRNIIISFWIPFCWKNADLTDTIAELNSKLHTIIFGTIVLHYYDSNWLTGEIDVGSEYNGKFPIVSLDYVAGTANGLVSAEVVKNGKFTVWMQGSGYVSAHVASTSFIIL